MESTKTCMKCGEIKPLEMFTKSPKPVDGRLNICKKCSSAYMVKRYADSPELQAATSAREKARHANHVEIVMEHYGRKCECCGETEVKFLTVDHIVGIGSYQKRVALGHNRMYSWLVMNNFPPGFRLLCSNCNHGRARNGGVCPHQDGSQARAQARSGKCREVPEALIEGQDMVEAPPKGGAVPAGSWSENSFWPFYGDGTRSALTN